MEKYIQLFGNLTQGIKKIYFVLLFIFSTSLVFGQQVIPTKTVTFNTGSCGTINVELTVQGINPTSKPLEVVLLIDVSGSMASGSPLSSMDHAKDAATDFINNIFTPANNPTGLNKVGIVKYSTTATIVQGLTPSSGQAGLISQINAMNAEGWTNIQDGIVKSDTVLTNDGTFDCNTARSIIVLTDGVANRTGTSGSTCTAGTSGSCIQSAITAATNAKSTTVSGTVYNNKIFSVGLFGGISGSDQSNAQYTLDNIQSSGAFYTESGADLTGIYSQILGQLNWIAAQIPGTSFGTETVNSNFTIVPGSLTTNKGSASQSGQVISWDIDFLNEETINLKYKLTANGNTCSTQTVSTSKLDYLNSICTVVTKAITTPTLCIPCSPVISGTPIAATYNCGSDVPPASTSSVSASDGCGGNVNLTVADVVTSGSCANKFTITRTWTATNGCGASSTASQTITVNDTTAPSIAQLPPPSTINCPNTPVFAVAVATDGCGSGATLTYNDVTTTSGTCAGSYSVTRTWTATDTCGNTATASQTINVQDVTAPSIATLPAPTTINCPDTPVFAVPVVTDGCNSTFTLTYADVTTQGACAGSYSVIRTWTATDSCNNTATASQTIHVQDISAPSIAALPAPSTISCPDTPVFAVPVVTDGCSSTYTLTFADVTTQGACAGSYSVTRTWTATDSCNNTVTASQTIHVQDITAPSIAALPAPTTINCPDTPVFAVPVVTDGCSSTYTLTFADVTTQGACAGSYSVTRTWTATDSCNNTVTASQTINVQDVTAPSIAALPAPSTINCPDTPVFAVPVVTDGCASTYTLTFADVTTQGACAGSYSVTRTWTATDSCNNTVTASQTINVQDVTAPSIAALPAPTTINCPDTPVFAVPVVTDGCSSTFTLTSADVTTQGACAGSYSVTRTWTATDSCNNTVTASQTIIVQDVTAPSIAALPAPSTISCPDTPVFAVPVVTDGCASTYTLTFADITTQGACAGSYSVTRTWTATDSCNNTATASQTINVQDVTAPSIAALPAPSTISCPDTPIFAVPVVTDGCASTYTLTFVDATTQGACAGSYSVTRTWTATDSCNNTTTASQTINVQDVTAPSIAVLPAPTTINCPDTPVFAVPVVTDGCSSTFTLTSADVTTQGACAGSYSVTRTWTATDSCNNTATASQTIHVQDISAPVISSLPLDSTINCPATPVFAVPIVTDGCSSTFTLTSADVTTQGACAGSYSVTRTWTATDSCNNTATASQTIHVQDISAPVISSLPLDSTINCPATPEFAVPIVTDGCSSTFTLTSADVTTQGACAGSYSVTRTWTATDSCNNTATASQTIHVQDISAPVISSLPLDSTINCPATPEFAVPIVTDGCSSTFTLTSADVTTQGACAGSYSVTRTWTATDGCGNIATASQTIHVQDISAPVISSLPLDSTINCPATPEFAVPIVTDGCSSTFTLTSADVVNEGACAGSYSVTRTWTATDGCGNIATASQTIHVQDVTAPSIAALPAPTTINCPDTPVFAVPVVTDGCSSTFTLTSADVTTQGACAGSYSVTRTWTATDGCNNIGTASQTIHVQDVTAPSIAALPAPTTISCPATPVFAVPVVTDGCGSTYTLTFADVTTPRSCAGSYSVTRTWTATDACNNTVTASQTIHVQDVTAPSIAALPAPTTISCPATPIFAVPVVTDGCASAFTLTFVDVTTAGGCAGSYSVTRTWTATDGCNNIATASQTIHVQDTTPPVIAALPTASTINCPLKPEFAVPVVTDACASAYTLTFADVTTLGACAGTYSITRTWTATDACNNTSTASQTINVQDVTAPEVVGNFDEVVNVSCDAIPPVPELQFIDACSSVVTVEYPGPDVPTSQTASGYVIIREWNVSDSCGNFHIFTQTINVNVPDYLIPIQQEACNGDSTTIDLINLVPPIYVSQNGTWVDVNNSGGLHGNNDGVFSPFGIPTGEYIIEYQIADQTCPRKVQITLTITDDCVVLACGNIIVHNAFSPNNDSLNEVFFIENIDDFICYPSNRVEIYNRWGVQVYGVDGYDNNTKAFRGISEGRSTVNQAELLPTGSYYYTLEYQSDGKTYKKAGYVYLSR